MRRFSLAALIAVGALMVAPMGASAATQIGETFTPTSDCSVDRTRLQSGSPGAQYAAPSTGVITRWNFEAGASPPQVKFKVGRPAGGADFTIIGESTLMTPVASPPLNSYLTQIPVQAGDVIGLYTTTVSSDCGRAQAGYSFHFKNGDVMPPTTTTFSPFGGFQLDVAALLEPDADQDGFGDESQDKCVGTPGTANGCPSTVTIDKLKQKGTKPKVKVTTTVPGAGTLEVGSPSDPALASAAAKRLKPVTTTLTATTKQQLKLTLKLTKSAIGKLENAGKLKLKVKAVYTPVGGPPGSQTKKTKLKS
jgi:hypothetical protein